MSSMILSLPLAGKRQVRAELRETGGTFSLYLIDGRGLPIGHGKRLSAPEVRALATARDSWKASLVWALLGYGDKTNPRKAVAATMCHPGALRVA